MTEAEVLQAFRDTGALLEGHFLLRSGRHSRQYFQCALVLQHPGLAERLCRELAGKLRDAGAQSVISPALGGLFIGHEVGRALGLRHIFVEKNAAGKLELRRSFQIAPGEKFLIVEDVLTRGGRVQETSDVVCRHGGQVVGIGSLVDRSDGKLDFGVRTESLLRWQVETFEAAGCPMCRDGIALAKPGS